MLTNLLGLRSRQPERLLKRCSHEWFGDELQGVEDCIRLAASVDATDQQILIELVEGFFGGDDVLQLTGDQTNDGDVARLL